MAKAEWKGVTLAESNDVELVEGNVYFPMSAVNPAHLRPSSTHTRCPWKGEASYFHVVVGDEVNHDAAWTYPQPLPAARHVGGCVAFWRGVLVTRND
ncbi:MAG: DUF427 domain-containing protein [Myxococcales bacterium]|nr:DUF427 domain-containing protein [Myxococcales bacterium]